jgi:hypothetical protein
MSANHWIELKRTDFLATIRSIEQKWFRKFGHWDKEE